jgi:hypothetical protein
MTVSEHQRLCDGCYEGAVSAAAECEPGCCQDLDHEGLCLKLTDGTCTWCGDDGQRLHAVDYVDVAGELPTVGEEDEGVYWLHWPRERQGPFASEEEAWAYWHAEAHRKAYGFRIQR